MDYVDEEISAAPAQQLASPVEIKECDQTGCLKVTMLKPNGEPYDWYCYESELAHVVEAGTRYLTENVATVYQLTPNARECLEWVNELTGEYLCAKVDWSDYASNAHGIVWAAPSTNRNGRIEFRVVEIAPDTGEPVGGRIFKVSRERAALMLEGMLSSTTPHLDLSDAIRIRDQMNARIEGMIKGERTLAHLDAMVHAAYAHYHDEHDAPAAAMYFRTMQDADLVRVRTFCLRHSKLNLQPEAMLRKGNELARLRATATSIAGTLVKGVVDSVRAAQLTQKITAIDGFASEDDPRPGRMRREDLTEATRRVLARALEEIEGRLQTALIPVVGKVNVVARAGDVCAYLAGRVTNYVHANIDHDIPVNVNEHLQEEIAVAINGYWSYAVRQTLAHNGLLAVMLSGEDAGEAVDAISEDSDLWYPIKARLAAT